MPLFFSILGLYNLLSKQPNYTCGLLFFFFWLDVYGCVLSQSNHEHFQKGLDFSREALLLYIKFPKINRKPNNSKTEGGKGHTGPRDNLERKSCLADSFLVPWPCPGPGTSWWFPRGHIGPLGQPRVTKSCLVGSSLVPWPCHGLGASRRLPTLNILCF